MLILHFFTLGNKNNERITRECLSPTGPCSKLQMVLGAYWPGSG